MEPMGGAKKGGSMMGLVTKDRDRKIKDMNEFNSFGTQNADTSLHEPPPSSLVEIHVCSGKRMYIIEVQPRPDEAKRQTTVHKKKFMWSDA